MATYKIVVKFNHSSAVSNPNAAIHRTGGWTESLYGNFTQLSDLLKAMLGSPAVVVGGGGDFGMPGVLTDRAQLLGLGSSITAMRVQSVVPLGPSQSFPVNLPGNANLKTDVPQMALLCASPTKGTNNVRRFSIRGVPDDMVIEGEYQPSMGYAAALRSYLNSLDGLVFKARDLSQPTFKIVSIKAATGLVTTEAAHNFQVGNMVRILKTLDTTKNLRGGRYQVTGIGPLNNNFNVVWNFTDSTGGSVRADAVAYPVIDGPNSAFSRIIVKKVGRPSIQYRGRRAKKR